MIGPKQDESQMYKLDLVCSQSCCEPTTTAFTVPCSLCCVQLISCRVDDLFPVSRVVSGGFGLD